MKTAQTAIAITFLASSITLTGCVTTNASKTGGNDYRAAETRKAGEVIYGTLLGVRSVIIRENEGADNANGRSLGTGGALAGATIGSGLGDSGNAKGAIFGALIGAVVGAVANNSSLTETEGWELDVQTPDGRVIVVVQAKKENESYTPGMKVRVVKYGDTFRVTPA